MVGTSAAIETVRRLAARIAQADAKVLITGESGVGKELVARYVHACSPRRGRPFIAVTCAGMTEGLLESELFGHIRGNFTGAYRGKLGKVQLAHRGTLFVDEVGEMSPRMQALLLRFVENGDVPAVGAGATPTRVDVRVIAATRRDLSQLAAAGQFREDLVYRLRVLHIPVPPLRERREDVRALVAHLTAGRSVAFAEEALDALERYPWPGNVRELQNVVEQLVWASASRFVTTEDLPAAIRGGLAGSARPAGERRRERADELFAGVTSGAIRFWDDVYETFIRRDLTREDLRGLVRRGLAATGGSYRRLLALFRLEPGDYKRLLNFLAAHGCAVDYREFRHLTRGGTLGAADALGGPGPVPSGT